jgi:hypothetical protein
MTQDIEGIELVCADRPDDSAPLYSGDQLSALLTAATWFKAEITKLSAEFEKRRDKAISAWDALELDRKTFMTPGGRCQFKRVKSKPAKDHPSLMQMDQLIADEERRLKTINWNAVTEIEAQIDQAAATMAMLNEKRRALLNSPQMERLIAARDILPEALTTESTTLAISLHD